MSDIINMKNTISEFIGSVSDNKYKAKLFNFVKKNSSANLKEVKSCLESIVAEDKKKQQLKLSSIPDNMKSLYDQLPSEKMKTYFLKLARTNSLPMIHLNADGRNLLDMFKTIDHFIKEMKNDAKIKDFEFNALYEAADKWEKSFTKVDVSDKDLSLIKENIVFTWNNGPYKGHFVYSMTKHEELQQEGKLMNHCVGGSNYFESVKNGSIKIFSLRTPQNTPLLTIETSDDMFQFRQVSASGNKHPEGDALTMLNEWKMSIHPKDKILALANSKNGNDVANAAMFMDFIDPDYEKVIMSMINSNKPNIKLLSILAENTSLKVNVYDTIYDRCKKDYDVICNLINNTSISPELFSKIYYECCKQ